MGNEDIGQAQILLQLFEQVQNLRLNGNVQRGNRLVANDDFGVHRQSAGNADTLTAAAVQLMRIYIGIALCQTNGTHQLQGTLFNRFPALNQLMLDNRLADKLHNGFTRVQRRERILENHLHFLAQWAHFLTAQLGDIVALEDDFAAGGLNQLQDAAAGGRFTAAGFAYDTQSFALLQSKAYTVDSVQLTCSGIKIFGKIFNN